MTWWKVLLEDGRGGRNTHHTDDENIVGRQAVRDLGAKHRWDQETGEYLYAQEEERPPENAKRIIHKDKRPDHYK